MKPRLRCMQGCWYCALDGIAGIGPTPESAWCDWHSQMVAEWARLMMGPAVGSVQ